MNLHIETLGSGRDLVLLHGWGMHGGVWNPVKNLLAQHFRVHIVDMPGFGYSAMPAAFSLPTLVEEIAQQVPEKITLCGWSLGGQVALQWALQRPEQLQQLVLVSTTPKFVNAPDWSFGIEQNVFDEFGKGIQSDYQPAMTRFLTLQAQGGDAARDTVRELKQHFFQRPAPLAAALAGGLALLQKNDLRGDIENIKTPTLILHGERDRIAPVAAGRWLAEEMGTQLHVQVKASHAPFLSHPAWFSDALIEHL